jgi:glutamyl-tRNA synthetase
LHLGHARTFLLAWWQIRSQSGTIVMRLEDLDGPRCEPRYADAALRDLEWLGLDWDGPALVQSHGLTRLNAAVHELLANGQAYPCVCSRGDVLRAQSAPHAGESEPRYPGTCRGRFATLEEAERLTGREAGLRLLVPEGSIQIDDGFAGKHEWDVARDVGDFLIARRDKAPAYQLAVTVDDDASGVDTVLRGDDLLPSTARQWHVQRALGLPHPRWFHVPLVVDENGRRLAKREAALSLDELRAAGTDPRQIVAWAAKSAGMPVEGLVTARELIARFDLSRVPRAPWKHAQLEPK